MKLNLISLVFSIIMLTTISCGSGENDAGYITYNLSEESNTYEVNLSDLMDNIHLVKLEFNSEFPVSERMQQWIGTKHILLISRNNVLQYTADGQFVRELITNGRGPQEFDEVDYYDVDEQKDVFYFFDHGSAGRIRRIDMNTGELMESILLPGDDRWLLAGFVVYRDKLLCFTNDFSPVNYRYFFLDDDGNIEFGCKKQAFLEERPRVSIAPYLSETGGRINFRQVRDTLFYLVEDTLAIEMIIKEENYFSPSENRNSGFSTTIALNGVDNIVIRSYELELLQMDEGGIGIKDNGSRFMLINRKEESITRVSSFYIDYFNVESEELDFNYTDDKAWIVISAIELIKYIDKALENKDIDPKIEERLLSFKESVNENDNPYFLIGDLK